MPKNSSTQTKSSTQGSLLISEIKDGVVVLQDGSLRAVVMASAINFDLMSQQEQNGIEYAYQGFLNSLHFPIQIVVKSQKIDLDTYIEDLEKKHASQDNPLLAMLMEDYIANVRALVEEVNIMDKQFYVVIPFFPTVATKANFFANLSNIFKSTPTITVSESEFQQYKTELTNRVQLVTSGMNQMGIRAIPLNTQELVELYYSAYNPDVAPSQKLINHSDLQTGSVVKAERPPIATRPTPVVPPEPMAPPQEQVYQPEPAPVLPEQITVGQPAQPVQSPEVIEPVPGQQFQPSPSQPATMPTPPQQPTQEPQNDATTLPRNPLEGQQ